MISRCPPHPSFESLEARIAPATFFLSGTSLAVSDAAGHDVNRAEDASLAGANIAVLLRAGDVLVLDLDGDHVLDRSPSPNPDPVLVKVTASQALVFVSAFSGDGRFDAGEISGLAVAHGFRGTVYSDVHGDVVTALTTAGSLNSGTSAPSIQFASIDGLYISGRVDGSILAGRNISHITIDGGVVAGLPSVRTIATGTATQDVAYHFGTATFQEPRAREAGRSGGDISDLLLANGCTAILTGEGIEQNSANAGRGGNISKVKILHSVGSLTIQAGRGGEGFDGGRSAAGGDGGSITHLNAVVAPNGGGVVIRAGIGGGTTSLKAVAGDGGGVSDVRVMLLSETQSFSIQAGEGGNTRGSQQDVRVLGSGGAGGAIERIFLNAPDAAIGSVSIESGRGGSARSGGRVAGLRFDFGFTGNEVGVVDITTGDGGAGERAGSSGGSGGSIANLAITGGAIGAIRLKTGSGKFDATDFDERYPRSIGGAGGAIQKVAISVLSLEDFKAVSGAGAVGESGGSGGTIAKVGISAQEFLGSSFFSAGAGTPARHGIGGPNGDVTQVRINAPAIRGGVTVECAKDLSDDPGSVRSVARRGGSITSFTIESAGEIGGEFGTGISLTSGTGGTGIGAAGGAGGQISGIVIRATGDIDGGINFVTGGGGDGDSGGSGGNVEGVRVKAGSLSGGLGVTTGDGGRAGGAGGDVRRFTVETGRVGQFIGFYTGFGGSDRNGAGGPGGDVVGVSLTATSVSRTVDFFAGNGGESARSAGRGGMLAAISAKMGTLEGASFLAGAGGASEARSGAGGELRGIRAAFGEVGSVGVAMKSGHGGYSEGVGQSAGNIESVALETGASGPVWIQAGGSAGRISSGHGGSIRGFAFTGLGAVTDFTMGAGGGGSSGGDVRGVSLVNNFPMPVRISAGYIDAYHDGPAGGFGGSIEAVTLTAPAAEVTLEAGYGASEKKGGGHGGDIRFIRGTVGTIDMIAGDGAAPSDPHGGSGNGGSVTDVRLNAVRSLVAGSSKNGQGGSIARVSVTGDIGDFSPGFQSAATGGIFAGARTKLFDDFGEPIAPLDGRTNGSVVDISAARIARIVAGRPWNAGVFSAVASVQRIHANALGIDLDGDGSFDFSEGVSSEPGFQVGGDSPDVAIDGLVIVRASGLSGISVQPLELVRVR